MIIMLSKITRLMMLAVSLVVILNACSKSNSPSGNTTEPKTGSKWVFKHTEYNESGTVINTENITLVASAYTYAGSNWILLSEQTSATPVIAVQKRADGWWQIPLPNTSPSLWFKTPAAINDQYLINISDGTTDTAKVNGTGVSLTVPAGTYNCTYVKSYDTNSLENEWWFSNGPLLIQNTEYDERSGGGMYISQRMELISYQP
jgi:hypothetical protein